MILKLFQPSCSDIKTLIAHLDDKIRVVKHPDFWRIEADLADPTGFVTPVEVRNHRADKETLSYLTRKRAEFDGFLRSGANYLGHVFAGSGFWSAKRRSTIDDTPDLSIRDWALVDIAPNREPDNTVSTHHHYSV